MASSQKSSLYPQLILSDPQPPISSSSSSSNLYPSIDVIRDMADNLFSEASERDEETPPQSHEEILINIPGSIVHLIQTDRSVELACGDFTVVSLRQGDTVIAVLARVADDIQWPLTKDEAAVKLDESHYFFTLRFPGNLEEKNDNDKDMELLNYGATFASKGQDFLLKELDMILERYSAFSVQEVDEKEEEEEAGNWKVIDGKVARETSPEEMNEEEGKKEMMEKSSAAYWTVLAPNVEGYSSCIARIIAGGSGQLIKGILWCGHVTVDRLKWGDEFLKRWLSKGPDVEINPAALRRIKRVKKLTKMSENVAVAILSGVVKVSGFFTSSIVNSNVGKKFFSLLPGEIVLASLDGFNKVCDAVEVAGKNVMSTSSIVTTGLVSQRYGQEAAMVTNEGLDATGHAIGAAWAVFKVRKALNLKSAFKPTALAKAVAEANATEMKAKYKK